jgi:hypothetical protein
MNNTGFNQFFKGCVVNGVGCEGHGFPFCGGNEGAILTS